MVLLLGLLARGVLGEKRFSYLLEVVKRMGAAESRTNPRPRLSSWPERLGT